MDFRILMFGLALAVAAPVAWAQEAGSGSKSGDLQSSKTREDKGGVPGAVAPSAEAADPDLVRVYDEYERAANSGERYGLERMCVAYLLGQSRPIDLNVGMGYCAWLPENNAARLFSDGFDYAHGLRGAKDEDGAAVLYRQAAEGGSGEAMDALGEMALAQAKPDIARKWFRQSAVHGALNGIVHYAATVTEPAEARWLYANAARNGSPEARAWLSAHPDTYYLPQSHVRTEDVTQTVTDDAGKSRSQAFDVNVDKLDMMYPRIAQINELEARVSIQCYVDSGHHIDVCLVGDEKPSGYGFGRQVATLFNGDLSVAPQDKFGAGTAKSLAGFVFQWKID